MLCAWVKTFPGPPRFSRINYPRDLTGASDRLSGEKYMYLYVCLFEFPVCSRLFIGLIRPTYIPEHWYLPVQHVTHLSYMQSTCSFVHTTCTFSDLEKFSDHSLSKKLPISFIPEVTDAPGHYITVYPRKHRPLSEEYLTFRTEKFMYFTGPRPTKHPRTPVHSRG